MQLLSLVPGDVVQIQEGPFKGLEAVFEREMGDSQRAVLLLQALSYQASLVVNLQQVVH
jgi:transcription antitermination factor NusG